MPPKPGTIEYARMVRAMRTRGLRELKEGDYSLRELLRDPPAYFWDMELWALLMATQGIGVETARRVCERTTIWPHTKLCDLSKMQRKFIIRELPERII